MGCMCGYLDDKYREKKWCGVPNYPASLDVCAEFEKTLSPSEYSNYATKLYWMIVPKDERYPDHFITFSIVAILMAVTPIQRCEAYLRVKGKWEEAA